MCSYTLVSNKFMTLPVQELAKNAIRSTRSGTTAFGLCLSCLHSRHLAIASLWLSPENQPPGPYTHAPYGPDGDTAHTRSNHIPPRSPPHSPARSPRECNGGEKRVRKSHRPNFRCQCPLKFRGCAQDVALSAPVRCKSREWTAALRAREEICSPRPPFLLSKTPPDSAQRSGRFAQRVLSFLNTRFRAGETILPGGKYENTYFSSFPVRSAVSAGAAKWTAVG